MGNPHLRSILGPHHHPPTPSPTSSNSPLISWFTNPPDYSYNHHKPNNSTSPYEIPPNLTKSSQPFFPGNIPEFHQNQPCPAPPSGALGPGGRPTHARARDGGRRPGAQRRHRRRRPAGSGRRARAPWRRHWEGGMLPGPHRDEQLWYRNNGEEWLIY